jgi:uncharacterized protein YkwD
MRRLLFISIAAISIGTSTTLAQHVEEHHSEAIHVESPGPYRPQSSPDLAAAARRIIKLTNKFRERQDLSPVQPSPQLNKASQYFANFMAEHDLYGHTADDSRPSERARKFGYDYCLIAENIAYRFETTGFTTREIAKDFIKGWKHSPEHRENMLRPGAQDTGVAVAKSAKTGVFYAVQMLGRPRSASIRFAVSNPSSMSIAYRVGDQKFELPSHFTRRHEMCREEQLQFLAHGDQQASQSDQAFEPRTGATYQVERSGQTEFSVRESVSKSSAD